MKKYSAIIQDGLILITVATAFVTVCNQAFKVFKKSADIDPIITAVSQESLKKVQTLLGAGEHEQVKAEYPTLEAFQTARANRADGLGRTGLMWAGYANFNDPKVTAESDEKRLPIVEALAKSGAQLDAEDRDGWTALMWASWSGLPKITGKLLDLGASTKVADHQGNTALMLAAQRGNVEVVKALLAKGADRLATSKSGDSAAAIARKGMQQYPDKKDFYKEILALLGAA